MRTQATDYAQVCVTFGAETAIAKKLLVLGGTVFLGRQSDAVVDCSGYTPEQLQRSAEALPDLVQH